MRVLFFVWAEKFILASEFENSRKPILGIGPQDEGGRGGGYAERPPISKNSTGEAEHLAPLNFTFNLHFTISGGLLDHFYDLQFRLIVLTMVQFFKWKG